MINFHVKGLGDINTSRQDNIDYCVGIIKKALNDGEEIVINYDDGTSITFNPKPTEITNVTVIEDIPTGDNRRNEYGHFYGCSYRFFHRSDNPPCSCFPRR